MKIRLKYSKIWAAVRAALLVMMPDSWAILLV